MRTINFLNFFSIHLTKTEEAIVASAIEGRINVPEQKSINVRDFSFEIAPCYQDRKLFRFLEDGTKRRE